MQAIIFTGIQATGKSTFYKKHFFKSHVRISLDLLNTRNKEKQFLETCFNTHTRFVIDNTNPTREDREKYIAQAKENRYEVIGYYFSSSLEASLKRNNMRIGKEKIPEVGIRGCYSKLEIPAIEEGFDKLYFVQALDNEFDIKEWDHEV